MPEGLWFSDVSRGHGMEILVIFGSINDDLIRLMMFPVYALWGHQRACPFRVFLGDIEWERWQEMGRAQKRNISNKSEDTSSKKSVAQKNMKKFSSLFLSLFVH